MEAAARHEMATAMPNLNRRTPTREGKIRAAGAKTIRSRTRIKMRMLTPAKTSMATSLHPT